jgi:AcrR family transcriptional regulator
MARPRSDEKRDAVVAAAIRIIAAQGLGAPTAAIAKEAGVSNGALFTYFDTKAALLNHLYLALKADMAVATTTDLPLDADLRTQMQHVWNGWLRWAAANPTRRRALALLSVSHDITPATRDAAGASYAGVATLLDRSRATGALRDAPLMFVAAIVMALVDTTINYMQEDATNGEQHAALGFEALWRAIS